MPRNNSNPAWDDSDDEIVPSTPRTTAPTAPVATVGEDDLPPIAAPAVASPVSELDVLPATIGETLALIKKIQDMPNLAAPMHAVKENRIRRLVDHHHKIANVLTFAEQIQELEDRGKNFFETIIAEAAPQVAKLKIAATVFFKTSRLLNESSLTPGTFRAGLERNDAAIGAAATAEEINSLLDVRARLVLISNSQNAQISATRIINKAFYALQPAVAELEAAFKVSLDRIEAELLEAERSFFASHGLPSQRTSVSEVINRVRDRLRSLTARWHGIEVMHKASVSPLMTCSLDENAFQGLFVLEM